MILRILVLIGLICVPLTLAVPSASNTYSTEYSDQPTSGGEPVFATKADVMINTIRKLIEAKEYDSAEKMAEEVTEQAPQMLDGWIMLGYTKSLTGKYEQSNEAYDRALEYGADTKDVLLRKAYNCRKLNDEDKTRECFAQLLEVESSVDILMQFGAFESSVANYEQAAQLYHSVVELDPENASAIDALSRVEKKLGNKSQVKYWLERGLALEPENTSFIKRLSLIYLNEQNYDLSIHYLNKLLELSPDDAGAHRNMGIAHYQKGEKKKAKESFEKVRELGGTMSGLYGPLADCYRSTGSRSDALAVIKEGIEAGEQEAWLYSIWGKLLEDQQEYDAAIGKFSKAVELKDEPWSGYARKQIARQTQLKKRAELIAQQKEG
jgi:tetratricopeptide (TPR) repeat protein